MSNLEDIKDFIEDLIRNETAVLKEVRFDQRGLEEDLDNLYILLNGIIIYCKCATFHCFNCRTDGFYRTNWKPQIYWDKI